MDITEFLAEFKTNLSAPESYLNPSSELSEKCLTGVKTVFDFYKECCKSSSVKIPNGPLSELYTEGFDNDQIWEEIQLMNEPVLNYVGKLLSEMESWDTNELFNEGSPQQTHSHSDRRESGNEGLEHGEEYYRSKDTGELQA